MNREGWICPRCRRVFSPDVSTCSFCDPLTYTPLSGGTFRCAQCGAPLGCFGHVCMGKTNYYSPPLDVRP